MPLNVKGECRNTGRTHFKKGYVPWNKNKTGIYSEETRKKMGDSMRGKSSPMKDKHHSEETRKRIAEKVSKSMLGNSYTKGKPWSKARREIQKFVVKKPRVRSRTKPIIMRGKEYHPDWRDIRKEIYKRDNWTCQECGAKCHNKVKIQCHHIDVNVNNNDNLNLITLCAPCHMKVHFSKKDWVRRLRWKNIKMEEREVAPFSKHTCLD